jgi:hypothetical protein
MLYVNIKLNFFSTFQKYLGNINLLIKDYLSNIYLLFCDQYT